MSKKEKTFMVLTYASGRIERLPYGDNKKGRQLILDLRAAQECGSVIHFNIETK